MTKTRQKRVGTRDRADRHAVLAMYECCLRGAARNYAAAVDQPEETEMANDLERWAIRYVEALADHRRRA